MILCLDVGNTTIHAGVYDRPWAGNAPGPFLRQQFRRTSESRVSSDEIGLFLRAALRENGVDPLRVRQIAVCSVVPDIIHSLRGACVKYFGIQPFMLQAGVRTGLKIKYRNPLEVGADRIANAIAGSFMYPGKNLIVVDFGTATTFDVVSKDRDYLGGAILPGLRLSMEALEMRTAKLPSVEIVACEQALGRSTVESIQSGLFFGHVGIIEEFKRRLSHEAFLQTEPPLVLATGGFAHVFENLHIFDEIVPDLVLKGLLIALQLNQEKGRGHATQHAEV